MVALDPNKDMNSVLGNSIRLELSPRKVERSATRSTEAKPHSRLLVSLTDHQFRTSFPRRRNRDNRPGRLERADMRRPKVGRRRAVATAFAVALAACAPTMQAGQKALSAQHTVRSSNGETATPSPPKIDVILSPADDIQAKVDASPAGTVFLLKAGVYRQVSFTPKDEQVFIGERGATLNGAKVIQGWRFRDGYWVLDGIPDTQGSNRKPVNDLFIGGVLHERVPLLDQLGPGKWYVSRGRAHVVDDPDGQLTEVAVTARAIDGGESKNVVIRNLIIEKYATAAQDGAVFLSGTKDWRLIDLTVRFNHGGGVRTGHGLRVTGGRYNWNGELGIGGSGDGVLVEGVEIAFNNYARYPWDWEAGGLKFVRSHGYTVRNCDIHDNAGVGIWPAIRNFDAVLEDNRVYRNLGIGIQYETSYGGTIRNNLVAENATDGRPWPWSSNILLQNSRGADVYNNVVVVDRGGGAGIGMMQTDFTKYERPGFSRLHTVDNLVHFNTVIHMGGVGINGSFVDWGADFVRGNRFSHNHWVSSLDSELTWEFAGQKMKWPEWRAKHEPDGRSTATADPGSYWTY